MEGRREKLEILTLRLYDAAFEGDVPSLLNLLQLDPLILDRCSIEKSGRFSQSPLHVAANLGHLEFVKEPLARNCDLCLARDQCGRNPIHVAAIRGQLHVVDELLHAEHQAAKEVTNRGETILLLCVKHRQAKALKFLVHVLDDVELLNSKDSAGNTALHLAVATRQTELVKFLLREKTMEKNAMNTYGFTAMDISQNSRNDSSDTREIRDSLEDANALPAKAAMRLQTRRRTWSDNQCGALMVAASLIATMAFQVGINPPGGVWQDDNGHLAGSSVLADKDAALYHQLMACNTVALISSLGVILLLISGFRSNRFLVSILMIFMWVAVSTTAFTYCFSVFFLHGRNLITFRLASSLWLILIAMILATHAILFAQMLIKKRVQQPVTRKLFIAKTTTRPDLV